MRILILGGYGVFGGRLAALLADLDGLTMLIAGRSEAKALEFCAGFEGAAGVEAVALDRADVGARLAGLNVDLLVDASGPFQDYGPDPYGVVRACLAAGVPYLDFADGADFVFGIAQFDAEARAAGVPVLSGVSSFPVLTAAVLRVLCDDMEVHDIAGGIAPSPYAGVGLNVMRAVVGYAGAPVTVWNGGQEAEAAGLASSMRYTVAPPGKLPLRNIHFSLVDVPDLRVIPREYPQLRSIWMGAGPVPEVLHRILNLLAKARARFGLPSYAPLAPLFYRVLNLMKFGEHRGGMFVRAVGEKDGRRVERSWHMLAEGDDGPYIPSMAVEALVRKAMVGEWPHAGARPATHALEVSDYEALFEGRAIETGMREVAEGPLYRRLLGAAYDEMPEPLQALHDLDESAIWDGRAEVLNSSNAIGRLMARVFRFPTEARDIPVRVTFTAQAGVERWERDFDGQKFHSVQSEGVGWNAHLMVEKFGPIAVALAMVLRDGRLYLVPRRWSLFGVPMPRVFLPAGTSYEYAQGGRFCFDVEIRVPLIGRIAGYRGWLVRAN